MTIIRNAETRDLEQIARLTFRFAEEDLAWGFKPSTVERLAALDLSMVWVVEKQGAIIGYAICLPRENDGSCIYKEDDRILELNEIYIVPGPRNHGTGSQLLQAVEDYARAHDYTKLFVYSSIKTVDPILKFYRANGCKTWAVQLFKEIS